MACVQWDSGATKVRLLMLFTTVGQRDWFTAVMRNLLTTNEKQRIYGARRADCDDGHSGLPIGVPGNY